MAKNILSKKQARLLKVISENKLITDNFYFGGGTVLAEYYLHHRYSEDLDFFSIEEIDSQNIYAVLKNITQKLDILKIDFQQSFNRNLFFIHYKDEIIKTEFTFFPFQNIEKNKKIGLLHIDSVIDIAVNKVFTIYQKPRSRDFIDLYFIIKKYNFDLKDLIKKSRIKFDTHIDYLQLGSQFLKAKEVKDYPYMIAKIDNKIWQNFFLQASQEFNTEILKETK